MIVAALQLMEIFGQYRVLMFILGTLSLMAFGIWSLMKRGGRLLPKKKIKAEESEEEVAKRKEVEQAKERVRGSSAAVKASFARAMKELEWRADGRDFRYRIPWIMTIGPEGSGSSTALRNTRMDLAVEPIGPAFGEAPAPTWFFFDRGVVIDVPGSYVARRDDSRVDDSGWDQLLEQLIRVRARRPLDGVLLTIPASALQGSGPAAADRLRDLAARIDARFSKLERTLGMVMPVYLLITQMDVVRGFPSLCRGLPDPLLGNVFGWSNPHVLSEAYSADWLDEAFDTVQVDLDRLQLEVFADRPAETDVRSLYMLPGEFAKLRDPLKLLLAGIFRETVYHESFVFRGIYFSGDASAADVGGAANMGESSADADSGTIRPVFLKDLFGRKIFPEHQLAWPARRALAQRSRQVEMLRVASVMLGVVGLLGMLLGLRGVRSYAPQLEVELEGMDRALEQVDQYVAWIGGDQARSTDEEALNSDVVDLLAGARRIDRGGYISPWILWSWTWGINHEMNASMERVVGTVGTVMHLRLSQTAYKIVEGRTETQTGDLELSSVDLERPWTVEGTLAYRRIGAFLDDLKELEQHVGTYQDLRRTRSIDGFDTMVSYAIDEREMEEYRSERLFRRALGNAEFPIFDDGLELQVAKNDVVSVRSEAQERLENLQEEFVASVLDGNPVYRMLVDLQTRLRDLSAWEQGDVVEDYRSIHALILGIAAELKREEMAWIARDRFDPGPDYQGLLRDIGRSELLGPGSQRAFRKHIDDAFWAFKVELRGFRAALSGLLLQELEQEEGQSIAMGGVVEDLRASLDEFMAQPFVPETAARGPDVQWQSGMRWVWDQGKVNAAVALAEPFSDFIGDGAHELPAEFQGPIRKLALDSLEQSILDLLRLAKDEEPDSIDREGLHNEEALRVETENLKLVEEGFRKLLSLSVQYGLVDLNRVIQEIILAEAHHIMEAVDSLLSRDRPYQPVSPERLEQWDGEQPLWDLFFEQKTEDDVELYLQFRRVRIETLANVYAAPALRLMTILDGVVSGSKMERLGTKDSWGLFYKWQQILADLDRFNSEVPGNTPTLLEKYVRDLASVDLEYCFNQALVDVGSKPERSWFVERRADLMKEVATMCSSFVTARTKKEYGEISAAFSEKLQGRFPFSSKVGDKQADPLDIRRFFFLFDKNVDDIRRGLDVSRRFEPDSVVDVRRFLEQMSRARAFFARSVDSESLATPEYNIMVEFRADRVQEVEGNKIIEWNLWAGDRQEDALTYPVVQRGELTWAYGQPITLTLRWAKDSEVYPYRGGVGEGTLESEELRRVKFEYDSDWALVDFIRTFHASDDAKETKQRDGFMLRFDVMAVDGRRVGQTVETEARARTQTSVFLKLRFMVGDEDAPILFLDFPKDVPRLDELRQKREAVRLGGDEPADRFGGAYP